jgi:hypothetical protein
MHDLMGEGVLLLLVCLAVSLVVGASRASSLEGVVRESLKSLVGLAGGMLVLIVCVELILSVAQAR